jgi:hypothetical protein
MNYEMNKEEIESMADELCQNMASLNVSHIEGLCLDLIINNIEEALEGHTEYEELDDEDQSYMKDEIKNSICSNLNI